MRIPGRFVLLIVIACAGCGGASAAVRRAEQHIARGEYDEADRIADDGLAHNRRDAELWHIKMRAALGRGDNDRAVDLYGQWTKIHGQDDHVALRMMAKTVLWQALRAPSAPIQAGAIRLVERLELEDFAQDVAMLIGSESDAVSAAAAVALLRSHPQAPHVATELLHSEDPAVRAIVVTGIGRKVGSLARDDLVATLADPAPAVRRAAVGAVAGLRDDADTAALLRLARSDPDGQVRAHALRAVATRQPAPDVAFVRAALADEYAGARLAAIELVVRRDDDAAYALLAEIAAGPDRSLAFRAAVALHRAGKPPVADVIERGLTATEWTVRAAALNAMADALPRDRALALAGSAIVDPRIEVRLTAARVLRRLGQEARARAEFAAALASPQPSARLSAALDLLRLRDDRGLAVLTELGTSSDDSVRSSALQAHLSIGRLSPAVVAALADDVADNRLIAIELLLSSL